MRLNFHALLEVTQHPRRPIIPVCTSAIPMIVNTAMAPITASTMTATLSAVPKFVSLMRVSVLRDRRPASALILAHEDAAFKGGDRHLVAPHRILRYVGHGVFRQCR